MTARDVGSDEELLRGIVSGHESALAALYDRYQGQMYGLATRITGDPALAQDVVQEAFLGVWRNAVRFSAERGSGRTWIFSIVHHRAIDAVRRRRATVELPEIEAVPAELVSPDVWPEVAGRLDAAVVRAALTTLPDAQREVIVLAYFGGLTQHEIAARTGAPLGTVKSRARLGLLSLGRMLRGEDNIAVQRAESLRDAAPQQRRPAPEPTRGGR